MGPVTGSRFERSEFLSPVALPGDTCRIWSQEWGQSMQLRYAARGAVWVIVYLLFILAPLFALLLGRYPRRAISGPSSRSRSATPGLAMMGLQFGLTARFRYVTEPWGEDVIYHFHRQISLIAVGLVVAHPLILFAVRPELLALLNSIRRHGAPASPRCRLTR